MYQEKLLDPLSVFSNYIDVVIVWLILALIAGIAVKIVAKKFIEWWKREAKEHKNSSLGDERLLVAGILCCSIGMPLFISGTEIGMCIGMILGFLVVSF